MSVRARWAPVAIVAAFELATGWVASAAVTRYWLAPLRRVPDGFLLLSAHGGRGAIDYVLREPERAVKSMIALAIIATAYALVTVPLALVLPATFVPETPDPRAPFDAALRRTPSSYALALSALVGYALAGCVAYLGVRIRPEHLATHADLRVRALVTLLAIAPAALLALASFLWRDLALTEIATRGSTLARAARDALRRMRDHLGALLLGLTVAALVSATLFVAAASLSPHTDTALGVAGFCALASQQIASIARVFVRGAWFATIVRITRQPGK